MLIAFVAIVALANGMLTSSQGWFGVTNPVKLETIFGWVNAPFAWLNRRSGGGLPKNR
jgi:nucleoside permease NupC